MQAGSLVGEEIRLLTSKVLVSGVVRAHESWSIDREIVGDLPDQVVAGGGLRQATGTIVWAEQTDVTDKSANPWNDSAGWLPKQGEQVIIQVNDGVTGWNQFVGFIDETTGNVGGSPQSSIIDYTDLLNRGVEHSTVFHLHPPIVEGEQPIGVSMAAQYAVDRALRSCGFYATPRMEPGVVFSVPGQMSMWPELGRITAGTRFGGIGGTPQPSSADWGWCMGDFNTSYTPNTTIVSSDPVQLTARIHSGHAGSFQITAFYTTKWVQITVNSSRVAIVYMSGVEVCRLTMEPTATIVTLLGKAGVWTLKTDKGATATGSWTIPAGESLATIKLVGDPATRAAGFQISRPPNGQEFQSLGHVDSYFQKTSLFSGLIDVLRSYTSRPAIEILTEISNAMLSPFWFDESGKLQMIGSDVLRAKAPVQTVTTLDDITKLSWTDSRLGVRSKVIVKYLSPTVTRSIYSNVTLWEGSGETLESGQVANFIMAEPADEDWAEVDDFTVSNAGGLVGFNQGRGTQVGSYLEDIAGDWSVATGYATWSGVSSIGTETKKISLTAGTLPTGKHLVVGHPDDAVNINTRFRGKGAPALRGRGKAVWTEMFLESSIAGPSGFPELEHDMGIWLSQDGETLMQTRMADFIAEQVSTAKPVITGMEVIYDPRRQLGDVITISSPSYMGVELTALIVGVSNFAGDMFTQSLDVRIITATTTFTTYAAHEAAYPDSLTYEQWRLLYPDTTTYTGFNTEPLRGAS